jgi:hypothetical protein
MKRTTIEFWTEGGRTIARMSRGDGAEVERTLTLRVESRLLSVCDYMNRPSQAEAAALRREGKLGAQHYSTSAYLGMRRVLHPRPPPRTRRWARVMEFCNRHGDIAVPDVQRLFKLKYDTARAYLDDLAGSGFVLRLKKRRYRLAPPFAQTALPEAAE